jgi:hypothetical protein
MLVNSAIAFEAGIENNYLHLIADDRMEPENS